MKTSNMLALAFAALATLTFGTARADDETTKKAETAENLAIALLLSQAQAAYAPIKALNDLRRDTAVSLAAIASMESGQTPSATVGVWWPMVQDLDRPALLALALTAQSQTAATASMGFWQMAAAQCAAGLVSRLRG